MKALKVIVSLVVIAVVGLGLKSFQEYKSYIKGTEKLISNINEQAKMAQTEVDSAYAVFFKDSIITKEEISNVDKAKMKYNSVPVSILSKKEDQLLKLKKPLGFITYMKERLI